jgi:hypothetical protein
MRLIVWLPAMCLILVGGGCRTDQIRWETSIDSEGTITRTVHLPVSKIPPEQRDPALWERFGYTNAEPSAGGAAIDLDELGLSPLPVRDDKELSYFAARYVVTGGDEVPRHYRVRVGESPALSENHPRLRITDYFVYQEFEWTETLTETVRLRDATAARGELIGMCVKLTRETLEQGLSVPHDDSALISWMETEGDRWLEEAHAAYLDGVLFGIDVQSEEFQQELAAIGRRHGLAESTQEGVRRFVETLLREKLRRADGGAVDEEVVQSIVRLAGLGLRLEDEPESPLDAVVKRVVERQYGSTDESREALLEVLSRLIGIHALPFFMPPEEFRIVLRMPGRVVSTTGELTQDGAIRWTFEGGRIAPFGFVMSCRSILPDPGRKTPLSPSALDRIVELVGLDGRLREVMSECGRRASLEPLREYRDQFVEQTERGEMMSVRPDEEPHMRRAFELWDILTAPEGNPSVSQRFSSAPIEAEYRAFGILFSFLVLISLLSLSGGRTSASKQREP